MPDKPEKPPRRSDLDRLRVLACLSTFAYHPLTVFDFGVFSHIKSHTTSAAIDVASRLLHVVRMPLFFLIAGMVGYLSIRRHSDRDILRQRAQRLLIPFLVGVILLAPCIKYFELLDGRNINWRGAEALTGPPPEILVFLRRFFTQLRWFSWSHMWFLLYLFLLGAALLPLMRRLARTEWQPSRSRPVALAPVGMLAVLLVNELALRPFFPAHVPNLIADWASVATYVICMIGGAWLVRFPDIEIWLQRWWPLLGLAVAVGIGCYASADAGLRLGVGRALTLWGALGLVIGLGPTLSRHQLPGETYLAEAVLPLYVLHLLPLVVIAFYVKDLDWPVGLRYATIAGGGFAVTLAIYHLLVRPFDLMRLALGLPARHPTAA